MFWRRQRNNNLFQAQDGSLGYDRSEATSPNLLHHKNKVEKETKERRKRKKEKDLGGMSKEELRKEMKKIKK